MPGLEKTGPEHWNRLFHNEGDLAFKDVTEAAGVAGIEPVHLLAALVEARPAARARTRGADFQSADSRLVSTHVSEDQPLPEWVAGEPDITMPELAAKLKAEKDVTAHPASLSRVLLKAGLSFKKNTAGHRGRARGRASGA